MMLESRGVLREYAWNFGSSYGICHSTRLPFLVVYTHDSYDDICKI